MLHWLWLECRPHSPHLCTEKRKLYKQKTVYLFCVECTFLTPEQPSLWLSWPLKVSTLFPLEILIVHMLHWLWLECRPHSLHLCTEKRKLYKQKTVYLFCVECTFLTPEQPSLWLSWPLKVSTLFPLEILIVHMLHWLWLECRPHSLHLCTEKRKLYKQKTVYLFCVECTFLTPEQPSLWLSWPLKVSTLFPLEILIVHMLHWLWLEC